MASCFLLSRGWTYGEDWWIREDCAWISDNAFDYNIEWYIISDLKRFRMIRGDDTLGGMIICETSEQARKLFAFFDDVQKELNQEASSQSHFKAGLILYDSDDKETRAGVITDFKDNFKVDILIVFNMLLTGFDAPRLKRLYFGRKLSDHNLLQAITRVNRPYLASRGLSIAVNWYLTPDDESNDGNIRGYLSKEKDRRYDPELYDVLREMCARQEKDIGLFAMRGMIPDAIYYNSIVEPKPGSLLSVAEKREARMCWHRHALEACIGAGLVFMDPDNGLRPGCPSARKDAAKFVYASEICDYYDRGQDAVYYCHKGRRTDAQWELAKRVMLDCRPDAALMGVTCHRGTQRSYIFMMHPQRKEMYQKLLKGFLETAWKECFTDEFSNVL